MILRLLLALFLALSLSSCAYFNTFFYAKKHFNTAQKLDRAEQEKTQNPKARNARSTDGYNKSIEQCRKVMRDYPDSRWADNANLLMARAYFFKQDYINARSELHKFSGRFPESNLMPDMFYWLGRTEFEEGHYEAARQVWAEMREKFPDDDRLEEVGFYYAQTLENEGSLEEAAEAYRIYAEENGRSNLAMQARIHLASILMEEKEYEECEAVLLTVKDKARDKKLRMEADLVLARVMEKTERLESALDTYEDLARAFDKNYLKGRVTKEDREAAIEEARQLALQAELDSLAFASVVPDSSGVRAGQPGLASNDAAAARLDEVNNLGVPPIQDIQDTQNRGINAPQINTPGVNPQQNRNQSGSANRSRSALNPFETEEEGSRELLPKTDPNYNNLARVMMREGEVLAKMERTTEAILAYEQIIAEYPKTEFAAEAQFRIAYTHEVFHEDLTAAAEAYSDVLKHGRSSFTQEAQRRAANLGTVQRMSLALADSVSQEQQAAAEAHFLRAELYLFQQERPEKALEEYVKIKQEFPGTEYAAKATLAEAWVHMNVMEDRATGQARYANVMRQYPNTKYGEQARRVLRGPDKEPPAHAFMGPDLEDLLAEANVASVAVRDSLIFIAAQAEILAEREAARQDSLALASAAGEQSPVSDSGSSITNDSVPGAAAAAGVPASATLASTHPGGSPTERGELDPFAVPAGASPIENIWQRTSETPPEVVRGSPGRNPVLTSQPSPTTPSQDVPINPPVVTEGTGEAVKQKPAGKGSGARPEPSKPVPPPTPAKQSDQEPAKKAEESKEPEKKTEEKPKSPPAKKEKDSKKDPEKDEPGSDEGGAERDGI